MRSISPLYAKSGSSQLQEALQTLQCVNQGGVGHRRNINFLQQRDRSLAVGALNVI